MSDNTTHVILVALTTAMLLGMIYLGWPITGIILFVLFCPN